MHWAPQATVWWDKIENEWLARVRAYSATDSIKRSIRPGTSKRGADDFASSASISKASVIHEVQSPSGAWKTVFQAYDSVTATRVQNVLMFLLGDRDEGGEHLGPIFAGELRTRMARIGLPKGGGDLRPWVSLDHPWDSQAFYRLVGLLHWIEYCLAAGRVI